MWCLRPSLKTVLACCKLASRSIILDCLCHIFSFILFQMFLKGWNTCRMWFGIAILRYARLSHKETLGIWVVTYVSSYVSSYISSKSVETVQHQQFLFNTAVMDEQDTPPTGTNASPVPSRMMAWSCINKQGLHLDACSVHDFPKESDWSVQRTVFHITSVHPKGVWTK